MALRNAGREEKGQGKRRGKKREEERKEEGEGKEKERQGTANTKTSEQTKMMFSAKSHAMVSCV